MDLISSLHWAISLFSVHDSVYCRCKCLCLSDAIIENLLTDLLAYFTVYILEMMQVTSNNRDLLNCIISGDLDWHSRLFYLLQTFVKIEIRSMERGIHPIALLALRLTVYPLMVAEILSLIHFGIMTLTLLGHVTSSVTWPLEPQLVVSNWSSVDTMSLSHIVAEILRAHCTNQT